MSNISTSNSTYTSGGLDTRSTLDGTSQATFQQMNGSASGVIAIETILGDGPTLKGNLADLVTRLAVSLNADGKVKISTSGVFSGLTDNYGLIADGTTTLVPRNFAPFGMVVAWTTTTAPTHWLLCDGSSLLRADYADLFAVIGTTYGAADGTHFNVPDLRGRTIIMIDGAANRITAASTDGGNADTLAGVGGAETHTLTVGQLPSNGSTVTTDTGSTEVASGSGVFVQNDLAFQSAGSGQAHSNTQPWIALNYIIYAGV